MAAADLDLGQLSSFCSLPEHSVTTLLDNPTADLVRKFLENISAKAYKHEELLSENLKLAVELENAVRGGETKHRVLKGSIEKGQKDADKLKQRLKEEENARVAAQTELENLRNSTAESSAKLSDQKARISTLESSGRDTVALLESKTAAYDALAEELNAQHQKTIELRREVSSLEQTIEAANTNSTSAKFREQGLQQEIESLKRSNDWLDKELKTKSGDFTKYRKEKSLRVTELQRQYDEAQSNVDAASRMETNLRRRLDEVSQKADESFSKIQQLQEEAAKKDEDFGVALDSANRLTELMQRSANTERQRAQEVSAQLETTKEDASDQIGKLSAEHETEYRGRQVAEAKVAELEVQIEHLESKVPASRAQDTGHQGVNGYATPTRGSSTPMGSPGALRTKGGLSVTQLYASYNELKADNDNEKRRNEKLSSTLDELIQELESREPEIQELRTDHSRLESDITEMSSLIDMIGKERDQALKGAKKWEGQVEAKVKEGEVLRQQLRDLSSQVKLLLMEAHLRDQGQDEVTADVRAQLERFSQGGMDGEATEGVTDTDRWISENLVAFRTIGDLQEQNANLLRLTRELGEKMEHEESIRKQLAETQNWDDLQQKYERCKDEIKSLMTQSQSYVRERDMFRRMLSNRGQLPRGPDAGSLFDESTNDQMSLAVPSKVGGVVDSIEGSPPTKDLADYAQLYREMQAHFDAYRNEAATDRTTLKDQVDSLSKLNGELRSEVARGNSQVTLAHERYEMLHANYLMLRNENAELQKRSQSLSENAARQELKVQQVAEDLVEAKGLVDSMRNETANLKASKEFWSTVEKRLTEDNESLLNERNRLNSLNANLQNLLNERERTDNEARRRLQTQADNLEKDLQGSKKLLHDETEENKQTARRREYDNEQSQKRIDDLVSSLGNLREQVVAANTSKDHLSTRVNELQIELRSAEERLHVLQKPSTASLNPGGNNESQDASTNGDGLSLFQEQQLAIHTTELKRDLDLAKAELENVKDQVEQYKAISQASEDQLQNLNETQDIYRQETDNIIMQKDAKIKELEQRVEDTSSELFSTNSELSNLRNEQAENGRRLEDHKKAHQAEVDRLKDDGERHASAAHFYQEDLKVQAEIAQQAQKNYDEELVKHADATKALNKVRADHNNLKIEIAGIKTEAESARTSLAQSEETWADMRARYDRELAELKAGRENLTAQNNRLHQQLDSVTAQISSLRNRVSSDGAESNEKNTQPDLDNLQEVIKYLRREKEIVDVQLELSVQESKRLKQQLDYTQSQLDDTRLRLNQQRHLENDSERSNLDHKKLIETINELNTFRESSVTLRAESRQAQATLAARNTEVEELKARIQPLQAEILELKNEHEAREDEMRLLKENSDRWQQRAQNVLQKYDRIDPAELEAMKEQLKKLEVERDDLLATKQSLQAQAENSSAQISQVQEQSNEKIETMRTRLTDQFKARSKTLSDKIKEKDAALLTATTEKQHLEQQLSESSNLQAQVDSARAERDAALEKANAQATSHDQTAKASSEEGQVEEDESTPSTTENLQSLNDRLSTAEARADEEASQSSTLRNQLNEFKSRVAELELQIKQKDEALDALKAELSQLRASQQQQSNGASNDESAQQLAKLQEDLDRARQDADDLRTSNSVQASIASATTENSSKSVAEQVAEHVEAVRAELEARHKQRVKEADETLETRTKNMRVQLTKKLTEGKAQIRQDLVTEHEEVVRKLRTEHERELEKLSTRHKDELDELHRTEDSRFAELRKAWEKDHPVAQNGEGHSNAKVEEDGARGPWQPSETEARAFIQSNELARSILRKNVTAQVNKAKDELNAQLKEEHEKALVELQTKANTEQERAVMMESKKTAVQMNVANNKARISQFKIGIVEKAAQETPQKAVEEVWLTAKDAKPPPAASTTATQPQQGQLKTPQAPGATTVGPMTGNASGATTNQQKPPAPTFGQPTPFFGGGSAAPQQKDQSSQQPSMPTFGRPSLAMPPTQASSPSTQSSSGPQESKVAAAPPVVQGDVQNSPSNHGPSAPQQRAPQPPTANQANAGTGPGALRCLQQSGLPVARGGIARGNTNIRGRGSGIGRGGPPGVNAPQSQQQGRNSPTRGGMNPGAKQFVPGNKRPRDDEHQGGDAGNGKRVRGGGGTA